MLEFEATSTTKNSHKPVCDVNSPAGMEVSHVLIVELIVAEEFVSTKDQSIITPTGAARVLRMQFNIIVTERVGMGISWDGEMTPMYDDVPASLPRYGGANGTVGAPRAAEVVPYEGPEFEYVELERIETGDSNAPPVYRERGPATMNEGLPTRAGRPTSRRSISV